MDAIGPIVIWAVLIGLYFLPAWLAYDHRKKQADSIAALNLFLGWTVIGWIAALIWSVSKD